MQKKIFVVAIGLLLAALPTFAGNESNSKPGPTTENKTTIETNESDCEPGAPIHGEPTPEGDGIKIWWAEGSGIQECLHYDDGINTDAVGMSNGGSFYWGIKFTAEQLSQYPNFAVTNIGYFDYTAHTGNIIIYSGTATNNRPDQPLDTIPYSVNGSREYVTWEIPPVTFDNTKDLWIVMHNDYGQHVASMGNYSGDPNGMMMAAGSGQYWYTMEQIIGSAGTWNLRCYITELTKGGQTVSLDNNAMANSDILKYNVYRSNSPSGDYAQIGSVEAIPGQTYYEFTDTPGAGTYYYQVRAEYGDCLSDPAIAAEDPSVNYVSIALTGLEETSHQVALFPNPTKSHLTIHAEGMYHITIINSLGQTVYDAAANDECILNMSTYEAGVYMVRVATENGVTVKRITVMQ